MTGVSFVSAFCQDVATATGRDEHLLAFPLGLLDDAVTQFLEIPNILDLRP